MQFNDAYETRIQDCEKKIQDLEKRIQVLESIANGSNRKKPGKRPSLSADAKAEVIHKHNAGSSYSSLATEYGVSKSTIGNVCSPHNKGGRYEIPVHTYK